MLHIARPPAGAAGPERQKGAVGNQGVDVRVEGHKIAEGLRAQDEGRLAARFDSFEAGLEQSGDDLAQGAELRATIAKERPDQPWQREHVLAMRHRRAHVIFQPLAVREHALLMTARAEIAGLQE